MFIALDKNNKRVDIEDIEENEDYYCPLCGEKLIVRNGMVNATHFAHRPNSNCNDAWHYDMSLWHRTWQNYFPIEYREIVKSYNGKTHRADILIERTNTVIEFQHSQITRDEFNDRNNFYNSLGYKVVWVFDVQEKYESDQIEMIKENSFGWKNPLHIFDDFNPKLDNVELFLQLQSTNELNEQLQNIKQRLDIKDQYITDEEEDYYDNHKDDGNLLVKIEWISPDGIRRFCVSSEYYDEEDIKNAYLKTDEDRKYCKFGELFDKLPAVYSKDHTTYYHGCPISTTHLCASCDMDISESKYNEIMPCMHCENEMYGCREYVKCRKRFLDLNIDENQAVKVLEENKDGFITKISINNNNGIIQEINIPAFTNDVGKSIYQLWDDSFKVAIFYNFRNRYWVKINTSPFAQLKYSGKVYGYYTKEKYVFPKNKTELFNIDKEDWTLEWKVK